MTADTVALTVTAGVAVLGIIGSIIVLAFRFGVLNGTVLSFMATTETYRASTNNEIGELRERLNRHIDGHTEKG